MASIKNGYISKKVCPSSRKIKKQYLIDTFLITAKLNYSPYISGNLYIGHIYFPEKYIGKRVKFKLEVIQE